VPADGCSPLALDTTGKYLYLLATNTSLGSVPGPDVGAGAAPSGWTIVTVALADGHVAFTNPVPPEFPASLPACAHALTEDGSSHVYLAAVVGDPAPTLVAGVFTTEGPAKHGYAPLASVPLSALSVGPPLGVPSSSVSDYALWVAFSGGLVGVNLTSGAVGAQLALPQGQTLVGLQYDVAQLTTYGLLVAQGAASAQLVGTCRRGVRSRRRVGCVDEGGA
jgi:hypothetical protein